MNQPAETASGSAVSVSEVTVRRGDRVILDRVCLTLPEGACSVLIGPNGCGKTTLTRAMTGHVPLAEGSVTVLGHEIGACDIRKLRREVAVVHHGLSSAEHHQPGDLVDGGLTALEAVLTGCFGTVGLYDRPESSQREAAMATLDRVGLADRADQKLMTLSTGEQRRVVMARALIGNPRLLILDEPTAGLDLTGREQLLSSVNALLSRPNHPTVLMITHHVEEIPIHTRQVVLMKRGRIVATGRPEDCITPERLSHLFDCRVFVRRIHRRWWVEVLPEAHLDWGILGQVGGVG